MRTASDMKGLAEFGVISDFSDQKYQSMGLADPCVIVQDGLYREYWNLCTCLIRSRATSMLRHVLGMPESLAGLLHSEPTKKDISLKKFQQLTAAYRAASARPEAEVVAILARSQLGTTVLQWAMKFAEATSWASVSPQLQELLDTIFLSIGQTIILENDNKELRDKEQRGSTSKSYGKFDKWSRPVDQCLLEKFSRKEVQISTCAPVPPSFDNGEVFQPFHGTAGAEKDSVDMIGLTGKSDWVTYNTVSVLDIYAEAALLLHGYENQCWDKLGGSWRSFFVPEGQVISKDEFAYLVVKVLKGVVVGWPVLRPGDSIAKLAEKPDELKIIPVLDLTNFDVIPTEVVSPLHQYIKNPRRAPSLLWNITGQPQHVLEWQAAQGFAHVPENSLKKLVDEKCTDVDEHLAECHDLKYSHKLALMLMMVYLPELSYEEALAKLLRRSVHELAPEASWLEEIDDEQVADCVLIGEQKETKSIVEDRAKASAKQASDKASVRELCRTFFPRAKQAAQKALTKAKAKALAKKKQLDQRRLYAALEGDVTTTLKKELPSTVRITQDDKNGRWLIAHPDFRQKSVSWTLRGQLAGSLLVLKVAWGWHQSITGGEIPPHLDFGDS